MNFKSIKFLLFIALAVSLTSCCKNDSTTKRINYSTVNNNGEQNELIVLELFTSEGCSDCPKSEKAIGEIVNDYSGKNLNVVALAEHVDYWNDLIDGKDECKGNWIDRFSNGHLTQRQFNYALKLKGRPATPQLYVNGKFLFTDPVKDDIVKLINEHKETKPLFQVNLSLNKETNFNDNVLIVNFDISKNTSVEYKDKLAPQIQLFLVESNIVSEPNKGENCGHTLQHTNITRATTAKTLRSAYKGKMSINFPADVKLENCSVIGLVQNIYNFDIVGGTNGISFKK